MALCIQFVPFIFKYMHTFVESSMHFDHSTCTSASSFFSIFCIMRFQMASFHMKTTAAAAACKSNAIQRLYYHSLGERKRKKNLHQNIKSHSCKVMQTMRCMTATEWLYHAGTKVRSSKYCLLLSSSYF